MDFDFFFEGFRSHSHQQGQNLVSKVILLALLFLKKVAFLVFSCHTFATLRLFAKVKGINILFITSKLFWSQTFTFSHLSFLSYFYFLLLLTLTHVIIGSNALLTK